MPAPAAATSSPRAPSAAAPAVPSPSPAKKASVSVAATAAPATTAAPPPPAAPPAPAASTTGSTSIKEALDRFERARSLPAGASSAAEKVELWGQCPPIEKMDASLGKLEACRCVFFFFPRFFPSKSQKEGEGSHDDEKVKTFLSPAIRHLSLSTNSIDRVTGLSGLSRLQTLSLGRNLLRSLAGVEVAAGSLEELWVSYNSLDKLVRLFSPFFSPCFSLSRSRVSLSLSFSLSLSRPSGPSRPRRSIGAPPPLSLPLFQAGAEKLPKLRVLLASNNRITSWAEVERLAPLAALTHLLLAGNPLATEYRDRGASLEYRLEMLRRLPGLAKIDGLAVGPQEREAVAAAAAARAKGGVGAA